MGKRTADIIQDHAEKYHDDPFFIYLPFQDVHSPIMVPKEYEDLYPNVKNESRKTLSGNDDSFSKIRIYSIFKIHPKSKYSLFFSNNLSCASTIGMVTAMDDAVGEIVDALEQTKMLDNTIIVFTPDVCTITISFISLCCLLYVINFFLSTDMSFLEWRSMYKRRKQLSSERQ